MPSRLSWPDLNIATLRKTIVKYFSDVKERRKEGCERSILSNSTIESISKQETWDELKNELEEVAIDSSVLSEKQSFITEVLQEVMEDSIIDKSEVNSAVSTLIPSTSSSSTAQLKRWDTDATLLDEAYEQNKKKTAPSNDLEVEMSELLALHTKGGRNASKKHGRIVSILLRTLGIASDERLIEAADEGDVEATVRLIRRGANPRATDKWLWTPLHMAAYGGFGTIAQILILHGADIGARTVDGETLLLLAERNGNKALVDIISEEVEKRERQKEERDEKLASGMAGEKVVLRRDGKAKKAVDGDDQVMTIPK